VLVVLVLGILMPSLGTTAMPIMIRVLMLVGLFIPLLGVLEMFSLIVIMLDGLFLVILVMWMYLCL